MLCKVLNFRPKCKGIGALEVSEVFNARRMNLHSTLPVSLFSRKESCRAISGSSISFRTVNTIDPMLLFSLPSMTSIRASSWGSVSRNRKDCPQTVSSPCARKLFSVVSPTDTLQKTFLVTANLDEIGRFCALISLTNSTATDSFPLVYLKCSGSLLRENHSRFKWIFPCLAFSKGSQISWTPSSTTEPILISTLPILESFEAISWS